MAANRQVGVRATTEGVLGAMSAGEAIQLVRGVADVTNGQSREAAVGTKGRHRDVMQL